MMHYGSWITPQQLMENRYYSSTFIEDHYRGASDPRDEDCEQNGDETQETVTTGTSDERSSSADIFRLEFAATQRLKLVSNAEGLFNRLVASNILPHNEQDQIEQWLCMKQEYEECITSDETASIPGYENTRRSLERIEEVTETDEKTDESNPVRISSDTSMSDDDDDDDEDEEDDDEEEESDIDSDNPDFLEKLDECMNKLKQETDYIIDNIDDDNFLPIIAQHLSTNNNNYNDNNNNNNNSNNDNDYDDCKIVKPIPIRNKSLRRNSMLPGSDMCSDVAAFASGFKLPDCYQEQLSGEYINDNSPDLLVDALKSNDVLEPIKTLKTLTMNNEVKQNKVKIIKEELDDAHKRIEELQKTIKMKEELSNDMVKNSELRKQKLHRKRFKVKKELNTRSWAIDKSISLLRNEKSHQDIELYKNIAIHYEQRLMDIEKIKQIAGDSAKKILELEMSLNASKMQMEKLQWQLKKEEERKNQLEDEVAEDQRKIKELVEKCNLTESKLQEMKSESEDERANSRMKNVSDQKSSTSRTFSPLDYLKIKSLNEEKVDNFEEAKDRNEIKILRDEIKELRHNKENLVAQTVELALKLKSQDRLPTEDEERKKLEWNESIEMIDTLIEKKNSRISRLSKLGGISINSNSSNVEESNISNKMMIHELLSNLRDNEVKDLFHTYYNKVIELKKSTAGLDEQNVLYDAEINDLKKQRDTLLHDYKILQKHFQYLSSYVMSGRGSNDKLQMVVKNFEHQPVDLEEELEMEKLRRENKSLKKKLSELVNKLPGLGSTRYPRQDFTDIKPSSQDKLVTKVTREKNKLIIQKTDCGNKKK